MNSFIKRIERDDLKEQKQVRTHTPEDVQKIMSKWEGEEHMTDLRKAAEMALEALEEINKLSVGERAIFLPGEIDDAMEALRQALAQPEQEPVAWADKVGAVIPHSHKLFQPDLLKDYTRPLYTAPPKREWVGLKGDEISECWKTGDVVAAVEAKLKEKNT